MRARLAVFLSPTQPHAMPPLSKPSPLPCIGHRHPQKEKRGGDGSSRCRRVETTCIRVLGGEEPVLQATLDRYIAPWGSVAHTRACVSKRLACTVVLARIRSSSSASLPAHKMANCCRPAERGPGVGGRG